MTSVRGLLAALLVLVAPLAGCLGDDTGDDGDDAGPRFTVFLASLAAGAAPTSVANVTGAGVMLASTNATRFLDLRETALDLTQLAQEAQAVPIGSSPDTNGTVTRTVVTFGSLTVGSTSLSSTRLEVPFEYEAGPNVDVTITLDLDEIIASGAPALANIVVERDGLVVATATAAELEAGERVEVQPLPDPVIIMTAVNETAPSFLVNVPVTFTAELPGTDPANIREVFWSFGDGTTTTGREVEHAFRAPGAVSVSAVVEGTRGQQARANTTVDVYFIIEDQGNVGLGTGGAGAIPERDVKDHPLDMPLDFTNVSVRLEHGTSGNLCVDEGTCAPGNLFVELYDPNGELIGEDTSSEPVKWINATGAFVAGEYVLRVLGDQGAAIGYEFLVEVHYL